MITHYKTSHQRIELPINFELFTQELEGLVSRFDIEMLSGAKSNPALALEQLREMASHQDFMIFEIYDHGALLTILGSPKKAKHYLIGNAMIASTMTKLDLRAGLYAPLRTLVSEQNQKTVIEYDLAANSFGQFGNKEINEVAQSLDIKMEGLLKRASELCDRS